MASVKFHLLELQIISKYKVYSLLFVILNAGINGKYWNVDNQGMINADCGEPQSFIFELRGQSRFSIKAPNNCYIKGEQNGIFSAKSTELSKATLWEY